MPETIDEAKYSLSPDQYETQQRATYESETPGFKPDQATYEGRARAENAPYFQSVLSGIDYQTEQGVKKIKGTYDDLVKNIQETYNNRGMFFSGESIGAEQKARTNQAEAITGLETSAATGRADVLRDQQGEVTNRAAQLREQDYQDYVQNRKSTIDQRVYSDLSKYIPKYAELIQQQTAEENSPWLDLPIDDETTSTTVPATTGALANKTPATRNTELEQKNVGQFGAIFGRLPGSDLDWQFVNIANYGYAGKRDVAKEEKAGDIFRQIFKKNPQSKEDWNMVSAIAYAPIS